MKDIKFQALMRSVKYLPGLKKPYLLTLEGKTYEFAGTEDIVPFVQSIGWTVEMRGG